MDLCKHTEQNIILPFIVTVYYPQNDIQLLQFHIEFVFTFWERSSHLQARLAWNYWARVGLKVKASFHLSFLSAELKFHVGYCQEKPRSFFTLSFSETVHESMLALNVLWSQLSECWDYSCVLPCMVSLLYRLSTFYFNFTSQQSLIVNH